MSKFIDTIIESTTKWLIPAIFGFLGLLIGSIYSDIIPVLLPAIIQQVPTPVLLKLLTVAIILFFLMFLVSLTLYLQSRKRLKPKFGVLWDKNKEAYCTIHEKLLTRHKVELNGRIETALDCAACNKTIPIINDEGKRLTLSEAKKLL
jgi:hypothetical protein